ncbi:hypothetical protein ACTFIU_000007 [Dictyostelium citrinum]
MRGIFEKLFGMKLRSVLNTGKKVGAGVAGEWSNNEWGYPISTQEVIFLANVYQPKHVKRHPYHIVRGSIAPLLTTLPLGFFVLNYFGVIHSKLGLVIALSSFIGGLTIWAISIVFDSLYDQQHTYEVKRGLVMGMMMFIISEVMFFFSFFWSYFYISLSPTIAIGCVWPPYGLTVYSYMGLPLLNTVLLLLSGAILTDGYTILTEQKAVHEKNEKVIAVEEAFNSLMSLYTRKQSINTLTFVEERRQKFYVSHEERTEKNIEKKEIAIAAGVKEFRDLDWDLYFFENPENVEPNYKIPTDLSVIEYALITLFLKKRNKIIKTRLYFTLVCAVVFLCCQGYEYYFAPFSMNDGIYGSLFFLLTGFHGFHVLVGSILIGIITIRFMVGNFDLLNVGTKFQIFKNKSTGFACTLFYWHFVDIVWIFLYIVIYWWGIRARKRQRIGTLEHDQYRARNLAREADEFFQEQEIIARIITPKYQIIDWANEAMENHPYTDIDALFMLRTDEERLRIETDEPEIFPLDAWDRDVLEEVLDGEPQYKKPMGYIWDWEFDILYPPDSFEEFFEINFDVIPRWEVDGFGDYSFYCLDKDIKKKLEVEDYPVNIYYKEKVQVEFDY